MGSAKSSFIQTELALFITTGGASPHLDFTEIAP
jgi:hypothetical protein